MLAKNKKSIQMVTNAKEAGTVIGNGIVLENVSIKGIGTVCIDGVVSGDIRLEGHLILGETGKIVGEVHAASAVFYGNCEGNVYVEETLRLASSSNVDGNVRTGKLVIDEGAEFHGTCNMDMTKLDGNKIISFIKEVDEDEKALSY